VSKNCNLLQHDDKPLDGYLSALCCPPLLIKWYGFDPKTKQNKEKSWSIKKNVKNVSMHQENNRKDKKNHQFWVFSTSFNNISNVLNFLGVVSRVSHHSLTHILSTLLSSTAYEPSWMSPTFRGAYFYTACIRDRHLRVKSLI
jgi:hypothetical protein